MPWPEQPHCEGQQVPAPGEDGHVLPKEAWSVAGASGVGLGPNGSDLYAVCPDCYDPQLHEVVEAHEGWLSVLILATPLAVSAMTNGHQE